MNLLTIVHNDLGIRFNVRLIRKGDRYGLLDKLVHAKDDPMVEFYDARYAHTEIGQFTGGRYFVSTLLEHDGRHGIPLDCGIADWTVSAENVREVLRALKTALATGEPADQKVHTK